MASAASTMSAPATAPDSRPHRSVKPAGRGAVGLRTGWAGRIIVVSWPLRGAGDYGCSHTSAPSVGGTPCCDTMNVPPVRFEKDTQLPDRILVCVAWPYANGSLHVGQVAGAYLPPDIFARYQRMMGNDVLMVSGSDAHGTPITLTAEQRGEDPEDLCGALPGRVPGLLGQVRNHVRSVHVNAHGTTTRRWPRTCFSGCWRRATCTKTRCTSPSASRTAGS